LHQLPVFTHAAVLLAFARLQLPAARKLRPGACAVICKVSSTSAVQIQGSTVTHTGPCRPVGSMRAVQLAIVTPCLLNFLKRRIEMRLVEKKWIKT
jgi:hypothetical protein